MNNDKKRKIRKPRVGEYFVCHDDPKYVLVIDTIYPQDERVRFKNCVTGAMYEDSYKHFNEFHTRVPI